VVDRVRSKLKVQNKIQALFKDPNCIFQAQKLLTKSHILDEDIQNLDCNVTLKCTVLYCTHQYRNNKSKISKFATFKFKDFSSTFKHLICFQALSKALKFLFQIQAFSRISQARYEAWAETSHRPMWYVQAAIHCTLHSSKDPRPGRGSSKADVEVTSEGSRLSIDRLHLVLVTRHVLTATVDTIQIQLLQQLHNHQQTTVKEWCQQSVVRQLASVLITKVCGARRTSFYLFFYCYVCTSFRLILYFHS